jgi:hypothetical protein
MPPDQTSSIWTSEKWHQQKKKRPDANQCRTVGCHKSHISLAPCEVCFADRKDTENQGKVDPNPQKGLGITQLVHIIILMKVLFRVALILRMGQEKQTARDTCTNDVAKATY